MKLIIDIPEEMYQTFHKQSPRMGDAGMDSICQAIGNGTPIPDNATRKDVHKLIFGIRPPELDSPYCECALADNGKGCEKCVHKNDLNCDVNWWNSPYQKGGKE